VKLSLSQGRRAHRGTFSTRTGKSSGKSDLNNNVGQGGVHWGVVWERLRKAGVVGTWVINNFLKIKRSSYLGYCRTCQRKTLVANS